MKKFLSFWKTLIESIKRPKIYSDYYTEIKGVVSPVNPVIFDESQHLKKRAEISIFLEHLCTANFVIVLLANADSRKLFPATNRYANQMIVFEISRLRGECPALQSQLTVVTRNPNALFQEILSLTGEQPFLTQILCDFAVKWLKIEDENISQELKKLVQERIVQNWRTQDVLVSHFRAVEKIQDKLNSGRLMMDQNLSIYDRDCFFLVSKGGTMTNQITARDPRERYFAIKNSVKGHIAKVLRVREGAESKRVTDQVTLAFFNTNRPARNLYKITDHGEVDARFEANDPTGDSFITPTFKSLMDKWFEERSEDRGGLVFIYTDGEFIDFNLFVEEIRKQCKKLNHHSYLKILIVGVGDAIQSPKAVQKYFELDLNGYGFEDVHHNPCNVVIFNRLDDVDDIGIFDAIIPQLEYPEQGLPDWLEEEYPEIYAELRQKYNLL